MAALSSLSLCNYLGQLNCFGFDPKKLSLMFVEAFIFCRVFCMLQKPGQVVVVDAKQLSVCPALAFLTGGGAGGGRHPRYCGGH